MDFDEVHSAGSKNEKTSKFGSKKIKKYSPPDLENSYSKMVYLGEDEREDDEEEGAKKWEAEKRESFEDNVVVKKVYNADPMDVKNGLEKERNRKTIEDVDEVKKGNHFNESKRVENGKHVEDENVEVKKGESFNGSEVKMESGKGIRGNVLRMITLR
ncbi:hypothetical protein C1H46_023208 [Malus baccata]|uniref:Uncharacterized protein n=1 Tax=Malus baccata TaxID=106549 RepID=A0A540LXI2_MALBA|nr:hypothetical protein C1H46_023208 [Malus baccata]